MGLKELGRALRPFNQRLRIMISRAVLRLVDDERKFQLVQAQGFEPETIDGVERFQNYGVTSHPHEGAEVLLLSLGGMRQHTVAIAVDDRRYRVTELEKGDVCLYTDLDDETDGLHRIVLGRGRTITMTCGASSFRMTPSGITMTSPAIDMNEP